MLKAAGLWSHGDVLAHQDDPRSASLARHALRRDLAAAAAVGIMNQGMTALRWARITSGCRGQSPVAVGGRRRCLSLTAWDRPELAALCST